MVGGLGEREPRGGICGRLGGRWVNGAWSGGQGLEVWEREGVGVIKGGRDRRMRRHAVSVCWRRRERLIESDGQDDVTSYLETKIHGIFYYDTP